MMKQTSDSTSPSQVPVNPPASPSEHEHYVQFYEDDSVLLNAVSQFLAQGLISGDSAVVLALAPHLPAIEERLLAEGVDIGEARESGRYVALDAADLLAEIMDGRAPNPQRFEEIFGDIIDRAADNGRNVRIFGELVALLAMDENLEAALHLESLWNELQSTRHFSLFCAYSLESLGNEEIASQLQKIGAAHSHVIPAERYSSLLTELEKSDAFAELHRRSARLEAEISARMRVEEQLYAALAAEQAARQEAEAAIRQRDEFLSIAAHDLRTPLTVLYGHVQLVLRRLKRGEEISHELITGALETVADQADTLTLLVNQLLDTSRLEAGKLVIARQPVDLSKLITTVVDRHEFTSDRYTFTVTAPEQRIIQIDPLRMEQVITNLIDNAIKYSPDGGLIELVLAAHPDGTTELAVRDHGAGVPEEHQDYIFDRFYQVNGHRYRSGLGLGLYISRQIVEQHGGEIRAEFPEDGGSRFVITLPPDPSSEA